MGAQGFEPCPAGFFWIPLLLCERASCGRHGSALQLVINRQQTHTSSFPCNWSPQYYQAILYPRMLTQNQFLACRRARFRRRSFFLRHFHRWLPVFFHAREPRFMVNVSATCRQYMSASDHVATLEPPSVGSSPAFSTPSRERVDAARGCRPRRVVRTTWCGGPLVVGPSLSASCAVEASARSVGDGQAAFLRRRGAGAPSVHQASC